MLAEAEQKGRDDQPKSRGQVEPFRLHLIETDFEVRAKREGEPQERGIRGCRFYMRIIQYPWRNREPQAERKARPILPSRRGHARSPGNTLDAPQRRTMV